MSTMSIGTCKLCLRGNQKLQDSHILPAWAYKICQYRVDNRRIEDPIWVKNGNAFQNSRQVKKRLLCTPCEQRVGKWEHYVAGIAFQKDGSCPAYSLLGVTPARSFPTAAQRTPLRAHGIDTTFVAKFAVSVIWRSHAAELPTRGVPLGDRYAEELRKFLIDEGAFPKKGSIILELLNEPPMSSVSFHAAGMLPHGHRARGGYYVHRFYLAGMYFKLLLGSFPDGRRALSLFPGSGFLLFTPPDLMDIFPGMIAGTGKARVPAAMQARFDELKRTGKL